MSDRLNSIKAKETAAEICRVIHDHCTEGISELRSEPFTSKLTQDERDQLDAHFAEIQDFSTAVGDYVTGAHRYRIREWLASWGGIRSTKGR